MHNPQQCQSQNGNKDFAISEPHETHMIDDAVVLGLQGIGIVLDRKVEAVCMRCNPSPSR